MLTDTRHSRGGTSSCRIFATWSAGPGTPAHAWAPADLDPGRWRDWLHRQAAARPGLHQRRRTGIRRDSGRVRPADQLPRRDSSALTATFFGAQRTSDPGALAAYPGDSRANRRHGGRTPRRAKSRSNGGDLVSVCRGRSVRHRIRPLVGRDAPRLSTPIKPRRPLGRHRRRSPSTSSTLRSRRPRRPRSRSISSRRRTPVPPDASSAGGTWCSIDGRWLLDNPNF